MKDGYTTNSHYFTCTFRFKRLGERTCERTNAGGNSTAHQSQSCPRPPRRFFRTVWLFRLHRHNCGTGKQYVSASNKFLLATSKRLARQNRTSPRWIQKGTFQPSRCSWNSPQPFHSQEWSILNFPCSLTRNITPHSMKNVPFHSLLIRWKMIVLPILTTSHIHFSGWDNVLFKLVSERV